MSVCVRIVSWILILVAGCNGEPGLGQLTTPAKRTSKPSASKPSAKISVKKKPAVTHSLRYDEPPQPKYETPHLTGGSTRSVVVADAAALEREINRSGSGDRIWLLQGIYELERPIEIKKAIKLSGRGMFKTTVKAVGLPSAFVITPEASGTTIEGLTVFGAEYGIRSLGRDLQHRVQDLTIRDCRFIANGTGIFLQWTIAKVHRNLLVQNRRRGIAMRKVVGKIVFNTVVDTHDPTRDPGRGIDGSVFGTTSITHNLVGNLDPRIHLAHAIHVVGWTSRFRDNLAFGTFSGSEGAFRHFNDVRRGLVAIDESNRSDLPVVFSDEPHYVPISRDLPDVGYRKPGSKIDPRDGLEPGSIETIPPQVVNQGQTLGFTVRAKVPSDQFQMRSVAPGFKQKDVTDRGSGWVDIAVEWKPDIHLAVGHHVIEIILTPTDGVHQWKLSTTVDVELKTSCQNGEIEPWEDCETGDCCNTSTCKSPASRKRLRQRSAGNITRAANVRYARARMHSVLR